MSRIYEQRSFGPTLDFEAAPVLGAASQRARHAYRARLWRWMAVVLPAFWITVAVILIG